MVPATPAWPVCTLLYCDVVRHTEPMRHTASVTAMSWIPSEAVQGLTKLTFESGLAHYDQTPPDQIFGAGCSLEELRLADRFRFANHLAAWIDVDHNGNIAAAGYSGGGVIGSTTISVGKGISVAAVALPDKQAEPEIGQHTARFLQTAGGRTGVPAPRTVRRPPFVQYHAPIAWSTLALTIHADGSAEGQLVGASPFPRHWVYDNDGALTAKTGLIDFRTWFKNAFGDHTPWGDLDSPALVTLVETALEREVSSVLMSGSSRPVIRRVAAGSTVVEQGDAGDEMYVLLDGVLAVEVSGKELVALGPGAVLGERSLLEDGRRTATLRAVTSCKLAVAPASSIDPEALERLAAGHQRERESG